MSINWTEKKLQNERARLSMIVAAGMRPDDPALNGLKAIIKELEAQLEAETLAADARLRADSQALAEKLAPRIARAEAFLYGKPKA